MRNRNRSVLKSALIAASLSAAIFAASATPADARSFAARDGRGHAHKVVRGNGHGHGHGHRHAAKRFVVPRHVSVRTVRAYDPYFSHRVFVPAHHHHHVVYRFPVYTSYGVVYHPYTYCGGDLVAGYGYGPSGHVSFGGPHFGVTFGF
jgi:hypothetical protein